MIKVVIIITRTVINDKSWWAKTEGCWMVNSLLFSVSDSSKRKITIMIDLLLSRFHTIITIIIIMKITPYCMCSGGDPGWVLLRWNRCPFPRCTISDHPAENKIMIIFMIIAIIIIVLLSPLHKIKPSGWVQNQLHHDDHFYHHRCPFPSSWVWLWLELLYQKYLTTEHLN